VRAALRVPEQLEKAAFDALGDDVLPPAGLDARLLAWHLDHADEQTLGQPVLALHSHRERPAGLAQRQTPVLGNAQQAVALHPGHRLADGRPRLAEPLRDPRPQRDDPLLLKLEHRPEVHLRRVDKPVGGH
jgi:hypothetical protein